jgi:hypothetical protein
MNEFLQTIETRSVNKYIIIINVDSAVPSEIQTLVANEQGADLKV